MGGSEWWQVSVDAGTKPLTREDLEQFFENLRLRDEEERRRPKGPCGCSFTLVGPKTMERLKTEGGGAVCGSCMRPFWIDPPETAPPERDS